MRGMNELEARQLLAALIDIYDDGQSNAPEDRCYPQGAWAETINEARAFLAAHPVDAAAVPADERAAFPRYTEWMHLHRHGEWSNGVPARARDHTGRMNDCTAARAVIEELAARAAACALPATQNLPELPAPHCTFADHSARAYTKQQMIDYGLVCAAASRLAAERNRSIPEPSGQWGDTMASIVSSQQDVPEGTADIVDEMIAELPAAAVEQEANRQRIGTAEIANGRVSSYTFEQTDTPDGLYSLYTAPPAQVVMPSLTDAMRAVITNEHGAYQSADQLYAALCEAASMEPLAISRTVATQHPEPRAEVTAAARDVLAERRRQVEQEGCTPERDDEYRKGELAGGAASYAISAMYGKPWKQATHPMPWAWPVACWKPTTPRRDLVKAGALILAEIERIDRAEKHNGS